MKSLSGKITFLCCTIIILLAFVFHPKWKGQYTEATLSWDVSGYYLYLPAIFIYNDITKCEFLPNIISKYYPTPEIQQGFTHQESGNFVMKYPVGQAILMSPFFGIGHFVTRVTGTEPADGFSRLYQKSVGVGMLVYSILGIYFLYLVLIRIFTDKTAAFTLLIVVLGTQYLLYASTDQCLTHSPLFFLYALLIYVIQRFYENPQLFWCVFAGFICGLMTLIRPTEVISVLIPIFWGLNSSNELKHRFLFFLKKKWWVISAGILMIVIISIQLFYWKYVTGDWVIYSYQDQGFNWLSPHFKDFTFSFSSGWLMYTPMMIFAVLGVPLLIHSRKNPVIWIFSLLAYYIVCAWDVWDYGGNSGRAMIQYYPLLAISAGTLLDKTQQNKVLTMVFALLAGLFMYFNVWWVYHCYRGEVPASGHSKYFYYAKAGRWTMDEDDIKLMDNRYLYKGEKKNVSIVAANLIKADNLISVGKGTEYTSEMHLLNEGKLKKWVRIYADVQTPVKEWNTHAQHILVYKFYKGSEVVRQGMLKPQRFLNDGERKMVNVDCIVPENWDKLAVYFWNPGSEKELNVRSVMVETFDEI